MLPRSTKKNFVIVLCSVIVIYFLWLGTVSLIQSNRDIAVLAEDGTRSHIWRRKILKFLELPWGDDSLMQHEKHINKNKKGGVSLSKFEPSSDQVIKPVNLDALSKWVGKIPDDVVKDMADIAPMLAYFGYAPEENRPNYGKPDQFVIDNTNDIKAHEEEWEKIAGKVKQLSKKDTAPRRFKEKTPPPK